ncbi:MAG: NUDIX hydrolase [Thioalkalispiraceae bacterium]
MEKQTNIQLGVGGVVFKDDAVLLVKRKNPPNQNQWAIPGGKVKLGEPLKTAVEREVLEETGIVIDAVKPIFTFEVIQNQNNDTYLHYVIIDFMAEYTSGTPIASDDALQANWIKRSDFGLLDVNNVTIKLLREQFNFP